MSELQEYFEPQKKTASASLPFIMRPERDENFIAFTSEHDGFAAFVHLKVRDVISHEASKAAPNETIGLLAGRIMCDERGPYTLVLAAQGARRDEVEASPSHVRISARGRTQVRGRLETSAYGLDLIGWYHSHPRFPARFSPVDVTEQSTWRNQNYLGIVISGSDQREPLGVYRGPQAVLLSPVTKKPPPPPPIIAVPPDTTLNGAYIEVKKEEPVAVTSMKSPAIADYTPRPHSEGVLRFLLLAMGVGFLVMTVGLIRLDYRITGIEKKLTFAGLNREPLHSELPGTATSSPASDSPTERVLPKETTANDKLILGDNPVTKTHPLLPVPATQATQRVKSGRNLKTSGKDAAKGKSGNNRRRSAKKALAPQTEAVNPNTAPANKTKIEP